MMKSSSSAAGKEHDGSCRLIQVKQIFTSNTFEHLFVILSGNLVGIDRVRSVRSVRWAPHSIELGAEVASEIFA